MDESINHSSERTLRSKVRSDKSFLFNNVEKLRKYALSLFTNKFVFLQFLSVFLFFFILTILIFPEMLSGSSNLFFRYYNFFLEIFLHLCVFSFYHIS